LDEAAHKTLDRLAVTRLEGVGPKSAERLERLGILSVQDLLFHLPSGYQDRTRIFAIGGLRPGQQAVVEGEIEHAEIRMGRRRSLLVSLADGTGVLVLRFFHFSAAQRAALVRGVRLRCFGEVRNGPASLEMVHPEYRRMLGEEPEVPEQSLTPIYPTTEGMHQLTWRDLTDKALARLEGAGGLTDWLPPQILQRLRLPGLAEAIRYIHRPPPQAPVDQLLAGRHPAQRRLALEELLAYQLSLRRLRQEHQRVPAPRLAGDGRLRDALIRALPFTLTGAQRRVVAEIGRDLIRPYPMMRLVQGDVGSGKTVVAALAALQAVEAGCQVAIMAPTELLAEQHFHNLAVWLEPLGVEVGAVTGRSKGARRAATLEAVADGEVKLLVGTHALFQEDVCFRSLGLSVVDEQHRFGVHQRLALREKGRRGASVPHQLIMTATPIPRSLAMTAYADLDLSVIDEPPPGRPPVTTVVLPDTRRDEVISRVERACRGGRQAYWVCTLVEESEALQAQAAEDTAAELVQALPGLKVGLVHGRMKGKDKEVTMAAFKDGDLDLLVATTVIEVGVDVPNASLMIIENPERLGLAQLHQLRGRVGRGSVESHCLLMYHAPLSEAARERLAVMRGSADGFALAQKDLELRGPGEVLGTRQTGEMQLRIADVLRDQDLLSHAQQAADELLARYPDRVEPLIRRWVAGRLAYGKV
jgi:ATP-dependent DNA helicase RecG